MRSLASTCTSGTAAVFLSVSKNDVRFVACDLKQLNTKIRLVARRSELEPVL